MHTLCSFRATFACSAAALALAALGSATCHAQGRGNPPPPPPEAYTACTGKTEGASVTLTMSDGKTLSGWLACSQVCIP